MLVRIANREDPDQIKSMVAQWLAHLPLVLEVLGSIPLAVRKISLSEHTFLSVICRDDTKYEGHFLCP